MKKSNKVRYGVGGVLVVLLAGGVLSDSFLHQKGMSDVSAVQAEPTAQIARPASAAHGRAPVRALLPIVAPGGTQAEGEAEDVYEARPGHAGLQLAPVPVEPRYEPETPTAGELIESFQVAGGGWGFGGGGGGGGPAGFSSGGAGGGGGGGGGGGPGGEEEPKGPEGCRADCKTEPPIVIGWQPPVVTPPGPNNPPPQFLPPEEGPNPPPTFGPPTFGPETPTGAVPEPDTWAMMLIGFFAIGAAIRARGSRFAGIAKS